jgi:hypothetical protein
LQVITNTIQKLTLQCPRIKWSISSCQNTPSSLHQGPFAISILPSLNLGPPVPQTSPAAPSSTASLCATHLPAPTDLTPTSNSTHVLPQHICTAQSRPHSRPLCIHARAADPTSLTPTSSIPSYFEGSIRVHCIALFTVTSRRLYPPSARLSSLSRMHIGTYARISFQQLSHCRSEECESSRGHHGIARCIPTWCRTIGSARAGLWGLNCTGKQDIVGL